MALQQVPLWEKSGPISLPDYQRRRRRWEPFRGRNLSTREAGQRRLLIRAGAGALSITAVAALALIVPRLAAPLASHSPQTASAAPALPKVAEKAESAAPKIHWKTVVATAYCPHCRVCETTGVTSTGREAHPDGVAVARSGRRAARLGTKVLVPGRGWLHVDDVGGGVESNQIDIRVATHAEAVQFGRRQIKVGVVESARG